MSPSLRPYPEYKPSGINWLGDVPAHWTQRRLKTLVGLRAGDGITSESIESKGTFPVYGGNGIRGYSEDFTHSGTYALIGRQGALCGNVHFVEGRFWASEHAIVAAPKSQLEITWLARTLKVMNLGQYSVSAAQPGIGVDTIRDLRMPLPPLDEQRAIADFLDAMDEKITRFIAIRRRMIALLEEQKQAIINQAVTRGLGPDVPLKPSGIDWLGDIPAHWDVLRGSVLFTERNQVGFPELPVLEVSLATGVTIRDLDNQARKQMMSDRAAYKRAAKDDLPYNMMRMWQGAVGVAPVDGLVSPAYVVLQPKPRALSQYFSALFKTASSKQRFGVASRGIVSDRDRLYWESFRQIHFAVPPKDEQTAIANFLDEMQVQITRTKSRAEQEIKLIQEYRTRLISDVVTGKLDVRGVDLPAVKEVVKSGIGEMLEEPEEALGDELEETAT